MVNKKSRKEVRAKKHMRIRNRFSGTAERPRLAVFRSNNHMYAQIIDDTVGNTLVSASTLEKDIKAELMTSLRQNILVPSLPKGQWKKASQRLSLTEAVIYTMVKLQH